MILNLNNGLTSWHGGDGTSNWYARGVYGSNNGDNNSLYLGHAAEGGDYRSKIMVKVPALTITKANKIIIELKNNHNQLRHSRAYLSNQDIGSSWGKVSSINKIESFFYRKNSQGQYERFITETGSPTDENCYLIFDDQAKLTNFIGYQKETQLFVYIFPFTSDSQTSPIYSGVWCKWRNSPSYINVTLDYIQYSKVGQPKNVVIVNKPEGRPIDIFKNSTLTINWEKASKGEGVDVYGYRIYYSSTQQVVSNQYLEKRAGTSSLYSITFKNEEVMKGRKGQYFNFWIKTLGTINGYDSDYLFIGTCHIINSPPKMPGFTTSGLIKGNGQKTNISIQNLTSSDIDGDKITFWYSMDNNPYDVSGPSDLREVTNVIAMTSQFPCLHIWARDSDNQYSNQRTVKVPINISPKINKVNYDNTTVLYDREGNQVIKNILASVSANKESQSLSYTWFMVGANNEETVISQEKFLNEDLQQDFKGEEVKIKVQITDLVGEQDTSEIIYTGYHVLNPINTNISTNIVRLDSLTQSLDSHFLSETVKFSCKQNQSLPYFAKLKKIKIFADNFLLYDYTLNDKENIDNEFVTLNTKSLEPKKLYSIKVQIIDEAEQNFFKPLGEFKFMNKIRLKDSQTEIYPKIFNPYDSNTYQISTFYDNSDNYYKLYSLQASIDNEDFKELFYFKSNGTESLDNFRLNTAVGTTTIEANKGANTISFNYSNKENTLYQGFKIDENIFKFFEKFHKPTGQNYNVTYRLIAKNEFLEFDKDSIYILPDMSIETTAPLELVKGSQGALKIRKILEDKTQQEIRENYLNPDELMGISYPNIFTKAQLYFDGNKEIKNNIDFFNIDYSFTLKNKKIKRELNEEELLTYKIDKGLSSFEDQITLSAYCKELKSELQIELPYPQIKFGRKEKPIVSIEKVNVTDKNVSLYFKVFDYGALDNQCSNYYFDPNSQFAMELIVTLEDETKVIKEVVHTISEYSLSNLEIPLDAPLSTKVFFKAVLVIRTNQSNLSIPDKQGLKESSYYTFTQISPFIYYGGVPTVSYRAHGLGINTNVFNGSEVVKIVTSQEKNKIVLIGEQSINGEIKQQMTILDLLNGSIDGAIVDCGTW